MSFLQPLFLYGLALAALPIVIHLINRQRHRTKPWAAMMFLLRAKRMTRGMARLRHWLIMAMRVLAVAALIFAISRPLFSGWLGLTLGGRPATVMILLDRSPSMEQQDLQQQLSKRGTGLLKLVDLVGTLGPATQVVLIESTDLKAREIESPKALLDLPATQPSSSATDIPAMLREAADYVKDNQTGRTDIWICSDLRKTDWDPESGRWQAIRQAFGPMQGIRFHLLNYDSPPAENVSVRVASIKRRRLESGAALVFDLQLRRDEPAETELETKSVPVGFVINGARSVLDVEMTQRDYALQGHVIPIDDKVDRGWGRIELPADANPQDNVFYFAFGPRPEHRTVVVADDPQTGEALRLAAETPVDPGLRQVAEEVPPERVESIDWDAAAMVLWQSALPTGPIAERMQRFVAQGRTVIFFPPDVPGDAELFGAKWSDWKESEAGSPVKIGGWRDDMGLLGNTLSGDSLPVGDLKTFRYCALQGDGNVLARFDGGDPLLSQASTNGGGVYFFSTLPRASHSSLARDGVVFYVMLQRALADGAASLGNIRQLTAGAEVELDDWEPLSTDLTGVVSTARRHHAGVYGQDERLVALNRPASEDDAEIVTRQRVDQLFDGLDYYVVSDQMGSVASLVSEIWRLVLLIMAVALMVEAALCIPPRKQQQVAVE